MGIILELEDSDFAGFIDDGAQYPAKVVNVRLLDKNYVDERTGEPVKKVGFTFRLTSDDAHDGQEVRGETSTRFNSHPGCKLKTWSEALLGHRLPPGYRLDTDDLVGLSCRVLITKTTKTINGEEKTWNGVSQVLPTGEAARKLAAEDAEEPF